MHSSLFKFSLHSRLYFGRVFIWLLVKGTTALCKNTLTFEAHWPFWVIFTNSAPLGRVGHRVAMFVCLDVCVSVCLSAPSGAVFVRPLIGPEVTWSVPGLIGPPGNTGGVYFKKEKSVCFCCCFVLPIPFNETPWRI